MGPHHGGADSVAEIVAGQIARLAVFDIVEIRFVDIPAVAVGAAHLQRGLSIRDLELRLRDLVGVLGRHHVALDLLEQVDAADRQGSRYSFCQGPPAIPDCRTGFQPTGTREGSRPHTLSLFEV